MWTKSRPRRPKVHLKYKIMTLIVATQEESPQIRSNMEPRGMLTARIHLDNPLVRELKVPRNCPPVGPVHILKGEERGGNIPRVMTLKSLRNPSHPLLMGILKGGKKQKLGYLA
jgi:hypothetical protein